MHTIEDQMCRFVYVGDNRTGGETYFPALKGVGPGADELKFPGTESGKGLVVKPRNGNVGILESSAQGWDRRSKYISCKIAGPIGDVDQA